MTAGRARSATLPALFIAAALVLAACSGQLLGTTFETTLVDTDPNYSNLNYDLPVRLGDTTGLVVRIEQGVADLSVADSGVTPDPADPNAFTIHWLSGACDDDVVMNLWPVEGGYAIQLHTNGAPGLFGGCVAAGIPRAVRVTMSQPIAVETIEIVSGA